MTNSIDWTKTNIIIPAGKYRLDKRVDLKHEAHVVLERGAELYCTDDVGLCFYGDDKGRANNSSLSGHGRIIGGPNCRYVVWSYKADHVEVKDVELRAENKNALYVLCLAAGDDVRARNVTIIGSRPDAHEPAPSPNDVNSRSPAGITIRTDGEERSRIEITNCKVKGCGIGILTGTTRHMVVADNIIMDNTGQHGLYLSHTIDCVVSRNRLTGINLQGMKVQVTDRDDGDAGSIIIDENDIVGVNSHGILLTALGKQTNAVRDVIVSNNRLVAKIDGNRKGQIGGITTYGADDNVRIDNNIIVGFDHEIWER